MRHFIGTLALFGLTAAGAALAQDAPITLTLKKAGTGETVREAKTETTEQKTSITANGQTKSKTERVVAAFTYTDRVIERPEGARKPTRAERTYEVAEVTIAGEKQDLGLKGKTVLIEKRGDEYSFTVEGNPVAGKAAEFLGKEFGGLKQTSNDDLLPKKPVRPGDTWEIDVAKFANELTESGLAVDHEKSSATGKLRKVYDKDGARYGVIEVQMTLAVNAIVAGQNKLPLADTSRLTVTMKLDGCIDGSVANGSGTMTMTGRLTAALPNNGQMDLDMTVGVTGQTEQVKK